MSIKLGTIRRGIDISKKPDFGYYIWCACVVCGKQRWTTYLIRRREIKYGMCVSCAASRQVKRKFVVVPLGSVANPAIGDIRYGQDIGKEVSTRYHWIACSRCGLTRWVRDIVYMRNPQLLCFACSQREKSCGHVLSAVSRAKIGVGVSAFITANPDARELRRLRMVAREPRRGWHHTSETKRKLQERNSGENGANWMGGVSFIPYMPSFNTGLKEAVFVQYDHKCYVCSQKNSSRRRKHQVHHIDGDKHNDSLNNLMELCLPCHTSLHEWKRRLGLPSVPTGQALLNGTYRSESIVL